MITRSHLLSLILILAFISVFSIPGCDTLVTETITIVQFDSTLGEVCLQCHTDTNDALIVIPKGQWENSSHKSATLIEATVDVNGTLKNTAVCGPVCHSGNGYVDFVEKGNQGTQPKPSVVNCYTCHMPHTGTFGSFKINSLRGLDTTGVILNNMRRYDLGKSNMCVECHQAPPKPTVSPITTVAYDFGPHFSAQADMLIGAGAFIIDSGDVPNSHRTLLLTDGCLNCHYGDGVGYSFGEHTFKLEDETTGTQFVGNCEVSGCHPTANLASLFDFPVLDTIRTLADSLETLLISRSILDSTDTAGVRFNTNISLPRGLAEILHNYLFYRMDGSKGVHNATFAKALLEASVANFDSIPEANFVVAGDTVICSGSPVVFADISNNATSWTWDFGDSITVSGGIPDPPGASHTYTSPGIYTVTLTIDGPGGRDIITKVNQITVFDSVKAAFTPSVTTGPAPLDVTFTDQSTGGPLIWNWDFGDGTGSSLPDPIHTYAVAGNYVVRLTVINGCNSDSTIGTDTIIVQ